MNNDISANLNCFNAKKQTRTVKSSQIQNETTMGDITTGKSNFEGSMAFLGNLGFAQVKMDRPVLNSNIARSIDELGKNFDYISLHNEFCDELVQKGYGLEDAIRHTDNIFGVLKDGNTYQ